MTCWNDDSVGLREKARPCYFEHDHRESIWSNVSLARNDLRRPPALNFFTTGRDFSSGLPRYSQMQQIRVDGVALHRFAVLIPIPPMRKNYLARVSLLAPWALGRCQLNSDI